MPYYGEWAPYVPVAARRHRAQKKMAQLRKKGVDIQPIEIEGRKIAKTFWAQAWCDHMESLGDFENRLPRGRTYVRNGSVCHLAIKKGSVTAMVSGSSLYNVEIKINVLPKTKWNKVKSRCAGKIGSLLELLQGRLSDQVMDVVTDSSGGLFPLSKEIRLSCSCPDWATMCKHVAAVLYGVGARLDKQPDLLFLLRGVKHEELISASAEDVVNHATRRGGKRPTLAQGDLGDVFGIDLELSEKHVGKSPKKSTRKRASIRKKKPQPAARSVKKKATKKNASVKKTVKKRPASKNPKKKAAKKTATKPVKKTATQARKKKAATRAVKRSTIKRPTVKKSTVKKSTVKKSTVKKSTVKKLAAKKRAVKKR